MDEEYRKLLGDIRCSHGQEMSGEPNQNISIHAQIPDVLDTLCSDDMIEMRDVLQKQSLGALENGSIVRLTVNLFIAYSGIENIYNSNVSVMVSDPVFCDKPVRQIPRLRSSSTPLIIPLVFFCSTNAPPSCLTCSIAVSYVDNGIVRVAYHEFQLPVFMVFQLVSNENIF
jgi:hypothetical protein|tara:strand:+ start:292 stop:804 length:513 start_codon:yes stop_codon:yes gene_type:complete